MVTVIGRLGVRSLELPGNLKCRWSPLGENIELVSLEAGTAKGKAGTEKANANIIG